MKDAGDGGHGLTEEQMAVFVNRMRHDIDVCTPLIDDTFTRTDIVSMILAHGYRMAAFALETLTPEIINDSEARVRLAKGFRELADRILES